MNVKLDAKILLVAALSAIPLLLPAQTDPAQQTEHPPDYPLVKPYIVQLDRVARADYTNRHQDEEFGRGNASMLRFMALGSFPIYKQGKTTFAGSVLYTHMAISNSGMSGLPGFIPDRRMQINDVNLTTSMFHRGNLWNKPVLHNVNIIMASTNLVYVRKVFVTAVSSLIFVKGPATRYTLGVYVTSDPSSTTPVIPVISYWHRLGGGPWEIDAVFPQKIILRKANFLKGWLSIGPELAGSSFFTPESDALRGNHENLSAELCSGIGYERLFGRILAGARAGYRNTIQSRLMKVYNRNTDYLFETDAKGSAYFNFSISFVIPNAQLSK
ncbi:hypothetical protein [Parapedobacter koreensis]|uniref:MetA-pathway of phenol degradation n=1 Tax=Parapedobacter koreensis TaxID=332977 RepID=A0A1H7JTK9_9SPHI|nr:hypothetical protein [Parapedobacter koreensis]SEK78018.1 hypothetical protein SAMN05421740_102673 [Parapedobacter koreensis]